MVQRPRSLIGQALRLHIIFASLLASLRGTMFEILTQLGGAITDLVGEAIDVFGPFPDVQHLSHANGNFGLALQETSRDGPAETRQGAGMANANRN